MSFLVSNNVSIAVKPSSTTATSLSFLQDENNKVITNKKLKNFIIKIKYLTYKYISLMNYILPNDKNVFTNTFILFLLINPQNVITFEGIFYK